MFSLTKLSTLLIALMAMVLYAPAVHAGIQRTCYGLFQVVTDTGHHNYVPYTGFQARRGCGSSVPNRCRERARTALHTCMHQFMYWDPRGNAVPMSCISNGVTGFNRFSWWHARHEALRLMRTYANGRGAKVAVNRVTHGGGHCNEARYAGYFYISRQRRLRGGDEIKEEDLEFHPAEEGEEGFEIEFDEEDFEAEDYEDEDSFDDGGYDDDDDYDDEEYGDEEEDEDGE